MTPKSGTEFSDKIVLQRVKSASGIGLNAVSMQAGPMPARRLQSRPLFGIALGRLGPLRPWLTLLGCGCSSGVEHNLAKVGVEGSNPFARSNNIKCLSRLQKAAIRLG